MASEPKNVPKKQKRGFASMAPERHLEIARMGGRSVAKEKRSFWRDPTLAAVAGRKGGQSVKPANRSFSRDKKLAQEAGRKGGNASKKPRDGEKD